MTHACEALRKAGYGSIRREIHHPTPTGPGGVVYDVYITAVRWVFDVVTSGPLRLISVFVIHCPFCGTELPTEERPPAPKR